jgi:hypothetical protein
VEEREIKKDRKKGKGRRRMASSLLLGLAREGRSGLKEERRRVK